ncbi:MAG TPA: hypothetical protein VKT99_08030 [Xanthobacteraceae bacterium]|jgi:hypothetical protein|nr:hypothetical protein [Xanthobacteraceae bacterium]
MLKKLDRPIVWRTLFACFFAGYGFAIGEAVQRVNDAGALDAVHQYKNILQLAGEYFDPRVTLFTIVFLTVVAVEAGFFLYQLRLQRQALRAAEKAADTGRKVADEKRILLARVDEADVAYELLRSIINVSNEA